MELHIQKLQVHNDLVSVPSFGLDGRFCSKTVGLKCLDLQAAGHQ